MEDYKKQQLANLIVECIKQDFQIKYISKNLIGTISVYQGEEGSWIISIPAQMYDLNLYKKKGVIVYNGKGSYASIVDETGGFSRKHKNYIDRSISRAIDIWMKENKIIGKVE